MNQPEPPVEKRARRLSIWRIVGTLLSLALLVYLVWTQGWEEFARVIRGLPLGYLALAVVLVLLSRLFVTLRWFALLRSAKAPIRFGQCIRLVFMGLFASNFLPSTVGGDLVRLAGAMQLRLDAGVSAASLLVDRLVGMAGMTLLLPVGLLALVRPPGALLPAVAPALAIPFIHRAWERLLAFGRKLLRSSVLWVRNPASLGLPLLCTLAHMLCTYLTISVLLAGMQQQLSLLWIGGLWSLSYFFSLAPFSINGLGLQEVSIAYLYAQFGGVSMEASLALAVLLRMLFLFASLPGALFLPDILRPMPASNPR